MLYMPTRSNPPSLTILRQHSAPQFARIHGSRRRLVCTRLPFSRRGPFFKRTESKDSDRLDKPAIARKHAPLHRRRRPFRWWIFGIRRGVNGSIAERESHRESHSITLLHTIHLIQGPVAKPLTPPQLRENGD